MPIEFHNRFYSIGTRYCCITLEKWYYFDLKCQLSIFLQLIISPLCKLSTVNC
ncbi:MAG: hypothetical protein HC942_28330 [Microcoleus sp. SU_5_6]|nr:hypothetical protein [Microcoleus sp. SU_5_6]